MKIKILIIISISIFIIGCQHSELKDEYSFYTENYTNTDNGNDISFDYPQFEGNYEKLNNLIKEKIEELMDLDENIIEYIHITYEINYNSKYMISITFIGTTYTESSPYPYDVLYTLNIDIEKMKEVKLKNIININEEFINIYFEELINQNPDVYQYVLEFYGKNGMEENFEECDNFGSLCNSFYDEENVIIIITVTNAYGDYQKVVLKKEIIKEFLKTTKYF